MTCRDRHHLYWVHLVLLLHCWAVGAAGTSQPDTPESLLREVVQANDLDRVNQMLSGESLGEDTKSEMLLFAIYLGREAIASTLLHQGADPNADNGRELPAVHLAVDRGHVDLVELLLQEGADGEKATARGERPIHIASRRGHVACMEALLRAGMDVDSQTNTGTTPLLLASRYGFADAAELLLDNRAIVSKANNAGYTPLHLAAQGGHEDVVRALLARGADTSARSRRGQTAAELAQRQGHDDIARMLTAYVQTEVPPVVADPHPDEQTWVTGVGACVLYESAVMRRAVAVLPVGTSLSLARGRGSVLFVETPSGQQGWVPRHEVCTQAELDRRRQEDEVPDYTVQVSGSDNGVLRMTAKGKRLTKAQTDAIPPHTGIWVSPTARGRKIHLGNDLLALAPGVLHLYVDPNDIRELTVCPPLTSPRTPQQSKPGTRRRREPQPLPQQNERVARLPPFMYPLAGGNRVQVTNPNPFVVYAGIRSGVFGRDFMVPAQGYAWVTVPNGLFDIYFIYSDRPDALFQGDRFTASSENVEIRIVQVIGGNYNIRQVP